MKILRILPFFLLVVSCGGDPMKDDIIEEDEPEHFMLKVNVKNAMRTCLSNGVIEQGELDSLFAVLDDKTDEDELSALEEHYKELNREYKNNLPKWTYREDEDEMSSTKTFYATLTSENFVNLDFPYEGDNYMRITIRKKKNDLAVLLIVDKGQYMSTYRASSWAVRFNDRPPKNYTMGEAASGSSDIIFINNAKDFLQNAKSSDSLKIEAQFYNYGSFVYTFKSKGLEFNH